MISTPPLDSKIAISNIINPTIQINLLNHDTGVIKKAIIVIIELKKPIVAAYDFHNVTS